MYLNFNVGVQVCSWYFHCFSLHLTFQCKSSQDIFYLFIFLQKKVYALISMAICTILILNKATAKDESSVVATLGQMRVKRQSALYGSEVLGREKPHCRCRSTTTWRFGQKVKVLVATRVDWNSSVKWRKLCPASLNVICSEDARISNISPSERPSTAGQIDNTRAVTLK